MWLFSRRWQLMVALVVGLLCAAGAAQAADSAEAEALIRQGTELRQQGRDVPALPLFQKAYDLVATPRTAGQLGLAEMALGYWFDAEQHLDEALASPDHPWVAKNSEILKQAVTRVRSNIAEIVITGSPVGARVTVNRRSVGALPLANPARVVKGKVDVEVSAPGFLTTAQTVQVKGGERLYLSADLAKSAPVAGAPEPHEASPAPSVPGSIALAPHQSAAPSPMVAGTGGGEAGIGRKIGWGLGIAAGAVLAGAIVETVIWQRKRGQFNDTTGCYEDQPMRGATGCSALFDAAQRAEAVAIIAYAAAALLAGGATALILTGSPPEPRGSAMACAPGLGSSLMSCHFSF